jgi:hypothetical protein
VSSGERYFTLRERAKTLVCSINSKLASVAGLQVEKRSEVGKKSER